MPDIPPDRSDRRRRPLPDIQPVRTSLSSSNSVISGSTLSNTKLSSLSSFSDGVYSPPARPSTTGLRARYPASVSLPARSQLTRVACETCRRRKTKCSGGRPRCVACIKNRSECTYQSLSSAETVCQARKRRLKELEDENSMFKELFQYLRASLESQSSEIVRKIRIGADIGTIIRQIYSDSFSQTYSAPETELRFKSPYLNKMPAAIQRSENDYLESFVYEVVCAEDCLPADGEDKQLRQRRQCELDALAKKYPPQYLKPYHSAKLVDPRLGLANVTRWTQVITDNELFTSMLSAYLLQDYPGFPVFHKDIFLQALVEGDGRFCSSLLVNALMAEACHCYGAGPNRPPYWDPLSLSYRFLAEAKRLWELEAESCTLVRMQAATLLYLVYAHNGLDMLGLPYLSAAVEIGNTLGLFCASESAHPGDSDLADARLFTAWAVFRHTTMAGFHFQRSGLMRSPPQALLPSPDEHPTLYGDLCLQYPPHHDVSSTNYGHLFRAVSILRSILNDIASVAFTVGSLHSLSAERWLGFRDELEKWFLGLPVCLLPKNIIWPAQFAMHMEYCITLIQLSRIRISADTVDGPTAGYALVDSARRTAATLLPLATIKLETIIRLYFLRHSFEYYEGHLTGFLTTMCNIAMKSCSAGSENSPEANVGEHRRSTLILCLKGLADQGKHVHIAAVICRLLLDKQIPEDLDVLRAHIGMDILKDKSMLEQPAYSAYPLDMTTMDNGDRSRLENLLRENNLELQKHK